MTRGAADTHHSTASGGERLVFAGFLAVLFWAPLPFASNRVWAGALLCLLLALLSLAWALLALRGRAHIAPATWRRARLPLAVLALVQAWVLLQTLPLPPALLAALSPQAARWQPGDGWAPLSLDPTATRYYLLRGCAISLGFFLAVATLDSTHRVRRLLQVLVASGTCQAVFGVLMVLTGLELGFFVHKYVGLGAATGTFVNSNHFAGYLVMCLAAGTGLLLAQLHSGPARSLRQHLRDALALLLSSRMRLRVYLALMVIALVMTHSRMGNLAFFLSLAIAGALALLAGRRFSWSLVLFLASLFLVDMLILGHWFGVDRLIHRLGEVGSQPGAELTRYALNRDSLPYLGDFLLTGSGGGSFYGIFPNYQGAAVDGYFEHVHNDYLEFALELGLPAAALLAIAAGYCLWQALATQRLRRNPLLRGAGFSVVMAGAWAGLHSAVDFNLQIPANGLTLAVLLALGCVIRELSSNNKQ
ncbi:O-antigen ligase domain-containing protein [Mangrovimicrobium sediminis]|uniref:O-antigen ligase domain-containing protein n=1 Tax=Mangrovimicrobium sediminis TaxID=2562682 RepID=A0A4Z0M1D3_9GAMM|nr:O-antigen ligase family protein [Haliea sp. SAOS-164]TGD73105.1 O-antigen ligase domain-containing protein [Haliea sp. SAOS-164]